MRIIRTGTTSTLNWSALILVLPLRNFNSVIKFAFFSGYSGKAIGLLHGQNCVVLIVCGAANQSPLFHSD